MTDPSAEPARGSAAPGPAVAQGPPSRLALAAVVIPIIALVVANNIGNALAPALLPVPGDPNKSSNPLLLIALSPALRNQIAVVNYVDPWWFMVVAGLRLLAADPLFFLLGRWYGDAGISWMEQRSKAAGEVMREVEKWFARIGPLAVVIAANNIVCLLAGASGMRRSVFWVANVVGTIGRLLLIMWFADLLNREIDTVLNVVGDYRPWLLGVSVAVVAAIVVRQMRSGGGQLGQLRRLGSSLASTDVPGGDQAGAAPGTGTGGAVGSEVEQRIETEGEAGQGGDPAHGQ